MSIQNYSDDCDLFSHIADSDEEAYTVLYKRYGKHIFGVAMMYLHDASQAGEIVQEVFLRIWEKRASLREIRKPLDFLFMVARNRIFDHFRKTAATSAFHKKLSVVSASSVNDADESVREKEYDRLLHYAVSTLPPRRQKIYILAKEQGLSYQEIAEKLKLSRFTVKNQMVQALQTLRVFLSQHLHTILSAMMALVPLFR